MVFKLFNNLRFMAMVVFSFLVSGMAASPPLVGGPAPSFQLKTVSGETARFSDFKGKFVVLNFWATWCGPCTLEMPELQKAHQSLNQNVSIVGINFAESEEKVGQYVQDHHLEFPVLLDARGNVSQDYDVLNLPVTYIITPDGIVREKIFGGGITREMIQDKYQRWREYAGLLEKKKQRMVGISQSPEKLEPVAAK